MTSNLPARIREELAITDEWTPDQVAAARMRMDLIMRELREFKSGFDDGFVEWLEANGGEIEIGKDRYYVGHQTRYKLTPETTPLAVLLTLMFDLNDSSAPGDFTTLQDTLSTSAFRPAAVRNLVGLEKFSKLYDTITKKCPKTGKPKKVAKLAPPKGIK